MIKIIGSSHIAKQSKEEISDTITKDKPDIVCVELDAARLQTLFSKQRKVRLSDITKVGLFGFLFAVVGAFIQRRLGARVGLVPGADMRTAIISAKKVEAKIFLIDQPIQITFLKLSKISFWEKIKLVLYVLFGWMLPAERNLVKEIDLRTVPDDNVIIEMISLFKERFPGLYKVLVEDRNKYMARAIKTIKTRFPKDKIIVVVGAGHKKELEKLIKDK